MTSTDDAATPPTVMTQAEWLAEAHRRFGPLPIDWRFVCPVCAHEASGADFKAAGCKDADAMRCECIGRYTGGRSALYGSDDGPCDYAGYGLLRLSPVRVRTEDGREVHSFAFGEPVPESERTRPADEAPEHASPSTEDAAP